MANKEFITLTLYIHRATVKAIFVSDDENEGNAVWIPKSQVRFSDDGWAPGDNCTVEVAEWIAEREGLI